MYITVDPVDHKGVSNRVFTRDRKKWQKKWADTGLYKFDKHSDKPKKYVLEMFSYPSGAKLHVGHWYNYGPTDSFARYKKMKGCEIFQPMGFDAFGLPTENFAIKTHIHPEIVTKNNVENLIALFIILCISAQFCCE